ncbi:MAG: cupin domain-containing protein [Chloroflexota bacterium]
MSDGYFITTANSEQVQMFDGVIRRTMATTDEAMLCEFRLKVGAEVPLHDHMNDQVGYVVSGKLEITIGGETAVILPGESYAIPGGVPHQAIAREDSVLIDVFSPPRNDYRTEAR